MRPSLDEDAFVEVGHLTPALMCEWLTSNKVLDIILGEDAHIEIVKRCPSILKFIARNG